MQQSPFPIDSAAAGAVLLVFFLIYFAFIFAIVGFILAAMWRVFTKAGRPGWEALVPYYNIYVMCKIAGRPGWWWVLMFVPIANIVVLILLYIDLARSFGQSDAFAVGLILVGVVFFPILAWGKSVYLGPAGPEGRPRYAGPGPGPAAPAPGPGVFPPPPPPAP